MSGNIINYLDDCETPTVDLLIVKILLNSIISTPQAIFMSMAIKYFYLNTLVKCYEYLQLKLVDIPEDVKQHYKLKDKVALDGWVYVEVRKGMYGLLQAGLFVQELLIECLAMNGYTQSNLKQGLWKHHKKLFCLLVHYFGIKHIGKANA